MQGDAGRTGKETARGDGVSAGLHLPFPAVSERVTRERPRPDLVAQRSCQAAKTPPPSSSSPIAVKGPDAFFYLGSGTKL